MSFFDDVLPVRDCAFCEDEKKGSVPVDRIVDRLDELLAKNDAPAAKRHLEYWLGEARALSDGRGELAVLDELIGFYRKQGDRKALDCAQRAEALISSLGLTDTVTAATVYLNIATAHKVFDEDAEALSYYEKARPVYENKLDASDPRRAGLYNNTAVALTSLGRLDEAKSLLEKALEITSGAAGAECDAAVTCLNLADLTEKRLGLLDGSEEIERLLERGRELLEKAEKDGYYAFVASKCAQGYRYYGYFDYADELERESERIYAGNRTE